MPELDPQLSEGLEGYQPRDARMVMGARVCSQRALAALAELEPVSPDQQQVDVFAGMPAGWDPVYWRYSQDLGCS